MWRKFFHQREDGLGEGGRDGAAFSGVGWLGGGSETSKRAGRGGQGGGGRAGRGGLDECSGTRSRRSRTPASVDKLMQNFLYPPKACYCPKIKPWTPHHEQEMRLTRRKQDQVKVVPSVARVDGSGSGV